MAANLPESPSIDQLKLQVKDLRRGVRDGDSEACTRVREHHPQYSNLSAEEIASAKLRQADGLLVLAREHGFSTWPKLKRHIEEFQGVERIFEIFENPLRKEIRPPGRN